MPLYPWDRLRPILKEAMKRIPAPHLALRHDSFLGLRGSPMPPGR